MRDGWRDVLLKKSISKYEVVKSYSPIIYIKYYANFVTCKNIKMQNIWLCIIL